MFDLLLRRAHLVDGTASDIVLKDGKITALGDVDGPAPKTIGLGGERCVSAGWIDSHIHCYLKSPVYHDQPGSVGIVTGVTTVVDAGNTGVDDIDDFYTLTREATTEVYALLNISRVELIAQNELADMVNADADAIRGAVKHHSDFIVGLEARMSNNVVGENGITPSDRAKVMQAQNGDLPLMVHIDDNPPDLGEVAERLSVGDIITHCYSGKPSCILTPQGELRASVTRTISHDVRLNVGHDAASLSFAMAKRAIELDVLPRTISSDIHCCNRISDPMRSLVNAMSKFLVIGMSPPQVTECITASAADGLRPKQKGRLQIGLDADLTLFTPKCQPTVLVDVENDSLQAEQLLVPFAAIRAGKGYMTERGSAEHTFGF